MVNPPMENNIRKIGMMSTSRSPNKDAILLMIVSKIPVAVMIWKDQPTTKINKTISAASFNPVTNKLVSL